MLALRHYLQTIAKFEYQASIPVFDEGVENRQECCFDSFFIQMGCAALLVTREFAVALPDGSAVLGGGMPGFGAVIITAISENDMGGQNTLTTVAPRKGSSAFDL